SFIDLAPGMEAAIKIRLTNRGPQLDGTLVRSESVREPARVLLFPVDYRAWQGAGLPPTRFRTTVIGLQDTFRLTRLLPGASLVVALPAGPPVDLGDPAVAARVATLATAVSLDEGERASLRLTLRRLP